MRHPSRRRTAAILRLLVVTLFVCSVIGSSETAAQRSLLQTASGDNIPNQPTTDGWKDAAVAIMRTVASTFGRTNLKPSTFLPGGALDPAVIGNQAGSDPMGTVSSLATSYGAYVLPPIISAVGLAVTIIWLIFHLVWILLPKPCDACRPLEKYSKGEVLVPLAGFAAAGLGCVFASSAALSGNTYVDLGIQKALSSTGGTFDDLLAFTNTVKTNLGNVVDVDVPTTQNSVVSLTDTKTKEIRPNISAAIDPLVGNITASLSILDGQMLNMTNLVLGMKNGTANVSRALNLTRDELILLNEEIKNVTFRNVTDGQYKIGGLPDTSSYASDLPNITSTPDFDDILNRLASTPDPKNVTRDINETLASFLDDVDSQTANITRDVNNTFNDVTKSVNSSLSGITNILDGLSKEAGKYKEDAVKYNPEVVLYNGYRVAAMTTMWTAILVAFAVTGVAVFLKLGIIYVVVAPVLIFFLILVHAQALVYAPMAMVTEDVCLLTNDIEGVVTPLVGGAAGGGSSNSSNSTAGGTAGGMITVFTKCRNGAGLTEAFDVGDRFNTSDLTFNFNASNSFNISQSFNFGSQVDDINNQNLSSINVSYSNFTTSAGFNLTQTLLDLDAARANISLGTFNFSSGAIDAAFQGLNSVLLPCCNVSFVAANYSSFNQSNYPSANNESLTAAVIVVDTTLAKNRSVVETIAELNLSIENIRNHIIAIDTNLILPTEFTLQRLKVNESESGNLLGNLTAQVGVLTNATNDLEAGIPVMQKGVVSSLNAALVEPAQAQVEALIAKITDFDRYGSCAFIGTRADAIFASLCNYLSPGAYMMWSGLLWGSVLMFVAVVLAGMLAKRIKSLGNFRDADEEATRVRKTAMCGTTGYTDSHSDDEGDVERGSAAGSTRNSRRISRRATKTRQVDVVGPSKGTENIELDEGKSKGGKSKRKSKPVTAVKGGQWSKKYNVDED